MNFSTDHDLLLMEPQIFRDVPIAGQERLRVNDGIITGTTLSSISADFESAQVDAGGVALVAGTPHEVITRLDANTLSVSLSREGIDDAEIPPGDGSGLEIAIRTFAPQTAKALWERFKFVYTPKHGSWLNMAEIELNVLIKQCLDRGIDSGGVAEATKQRDFNNRLAIYHSRCQNQAHASV